MRVNMFSRISAALKLQILSGQASSADYEHVEEVVGVRASKEATIRAEELLNSTVDLVELGISSTEAIDSLRSLDPSEETADLALGLLRVEYFPFERRDANTAWRYLVAVKHGGDVVSPSEEEAQRIDCVEALARLDPKSAYEHLTALEPRLGDVQDVVNRQCSQWDGSSIDRDGFLEIDRMLAPYLGPQSNQSDFPLSSRYAFHIGRVYLISVANLLR